MEWETTPVHKKGDVGMNLTKGTKILYNYGGKEEGKILNWYTSETGERFYRVRRKGWLRMVDIISSSQILGVL